MSYKGSIAFWVKLELSFYRISIKFLDRMSIAKTIRSEETGSLCLSPLLPINSPLGLMLKEVVVIHSQSQLAYEYIWYAESLENIQQERLVKGIKIF